MKLSVIIPTLNEACSLPPLLADLASQINIHLTVIVSDGGSTDDTLAILAKSQLKIVQGPKGRAQQLNRGFAAAHDEFVLFLHADSRLPSENLLSQALAALLLKSSTLKHTRVAGHFPLKFMRSSSGHAKSFQYIEEKTHFNRTNTTNGDQGFLMATSYFKSLGGFDEGLPFLEDQKLAELIRAKGCWMTLPGHLQTSARRFEVEGFHRRYILMGMIMGLYSVGSVHFFNRAKNVYKEQSESTHLLLWPFFACVWKMMWQDLSIKQNITTWLGIGRYIRNNSWQMFYFFDILNRSPAEPKKYPLLNFHDKVFWPITNNFLCDCINTLISFFWFMGCLGPYFFLVENGSLFFANLLKDPAKGSTK